MTPPTLLLAADTRIKARVFQSLRQALKHLTALPIQHPCL